MLAETTAHLTRDLEALAAQVPELRGPGMVPLQLGVDGQGLGERVMGLDAL